MLLSEQELREKCPLKWCPEVPPNGSALGIADIDFKGPDTVLDFLKAHLKEVYEFYQPREGLPLAINAGLKFLQELGVKSVESEHLQVIPGTMMGIYAAMEWASRQGGEIILIDPIYPPILEHAKNHGKVKFVHLDETKDWRFDEEAFKHAVTTETTMVALVNPNNPTGTHFQEQELRVIGDLAEEYEFTVFTDELYEPLVFEHEHTPMGAIPQVHGRLISLYGFSKAYGLAGFRSGFLYLNHEQHDEIKHIISEVLVSPSPITSLIMKYALTDPVAQQWKQTFAEKMKETTSYATKYLNDHGIPTIQPRGTFFVFPDIKVNDKDFVNYLMKEHATQIVPGFVFGPAGKHHVRINCATSNERLQKGLERIISGLKQYNNKN